MMIRLGLCAALICSTALAQDPLVVTSRAGFQITGIADPQIIGDVLLVSPVEGQRIQKNPVAIVDVASEAANVDVRISDVARVPVVVNEIAKRSYLLGNPGRYWVDVTAIDFGANIYATRQLIVEVAAAPEPGPEPGPGPQPPGPTPGPAPIDGSGLRVLIVFESSDNLSHAHMSLIYGADYRSFLNGICVKEGQTPEWRILDKDTQFKSQSKWSKALARPRQSLPWIIVSNGTSGYEGPLPESVSEAKEIVQRFAVVSGTPQPTVIVHKMDNCQWCDVFDSQDKPNINGVYWSEMKGGAEKYPSFTIIVGDQRRFLSGYHSHVRLSAEIERIKRISQ